MIANRRPCRLCPTVAGRFSRLFKITFVLAAGLAIQSAHPRTATARLVDPLKIPLEATVTNGNVVFSWAVQTRPTELQVKEIGTDEWKAVPAGDFKTNQNSVTATLPLSGKPVYYRLKHPPYGHRPVQAANLPAMPMPPAVTNRPSRLKASAP